MRVTIALGGNALLQRGQPLDAQVQQENVREAAAVLAQIARDHEVVVTHGNGPQVGLLALQAESYTGAAPFPLDVLGAESEGMLGYLIEQELANQLPDRDVAALLTRVEVHHNDPAFEQPTKPIGPVYTKEQAEQIAQKRGWTIAKDGTGYRRVVPSPVPRRILELRTIELLLSAGHLVVCAGGGGIPVVQAADASLHGVEAVIDKDLTASLLSRELNSDLLMLLTDVNGVYPDWPDASGEPIKTISPTELHQYQFDVGSMAPKVEAACQFVESTGQQAAIGSLREAVAVFKGTSGTQIQILG